MSGVTDALTVQQMVGLFLDAKEINVPSEEMEEATWKSYEPFGNRMTREEADFYALRRTCAGIGLQVNDDEAVRTILAHKRLPADMLGVYNRLQVSDERLRAVTDDIHKWLFSAAATLAAESGDGQPADLSEQAV